MRKEENGNVYSSYLPIMCINGIVAVIVSILLCFLFSLLILYELFPESILYHLSVVSVLLSSLVTGFASARKMGKAIVTALCQGLFNLIILYLTGMVVFLRFIPSEFDFSILIACMVGAVIGGMCSALFLPRRRKIKNKQRRMLS